MTERTCIFAYTPNDPHYPPYINFSVVDGKLVVTMRGERRAGGSVLEIKELLATAHDGQTVLRYDSPGHGVSMELPDEQAAELRRALAALPRSFVINGLQYRATGATISYEDIIKLAGQSSEATVVVHYKSDRKNRSLCPGESADVEDGMVINAVVTGNA